MKTFARQFTLLCLSLLLVAATAWAQSAPVPENPDGSIDAANTATQEGAGPLNPEEAQDHGAGHTEGATEAEDHGDGHGAETHGAEGGHGEGGHEEGGQKSVFSPHAGTWVNPIARAVAGQGPVVRTEHAGEVHFTNIDYDVYIIGLLAALGLAAVWVSAARKARVYPQGKASSTANMLEAALEGFQNYLIGIMGRALAVKYAPLLASFFFTILLFNLLGLVPGLLKPTTNPNIILGMALFGFLAVHAIAIKEAGLKSWAMHFVGEPKWLFFLNTPLHIIGELIKPISLTLRLLCNMFGEEMVVIQLTLLSLAAGASLGGLPTFIPFQLPMLLLGTFFSFLQALVFTTLLAIYLTIFATHHDDHDGHGHEHKEVVHVHGHREIVAHGTEVPVA